MKKTPVKINFNSAKLKALQHYLQQNDSSVEEELRDYLDEIYDQEVSQELKDAFNSQSDDMDVDSEDGKKLSDSDKNNQTAAQEETSEQSMAMKM